MKLHLMIIILLFLSIKLSKINAQTNVIEEDCPNCFCYIVEIDPEFPGGNDSLFNFIKNNLIYPPTASDFCFEGLVVVSFVVEKNGKISNTKILKGVSPLLDTACVKLVRKMPNWKPGVQCGKPVRVHINLPIRIRAEDYSCNSDTIDSSFQKNQISQKHDTINFEKIEAKKIHSNLLQEPVKPKLIRWLDFDISRSYNIKTPVSIENNMQISIYPNPSSSFIRIHSNGLSNLSYQIFDVSGGLVKRGSKLNEDLFISLKDVSNGIYIISIFDNDNYKKSNHQFIVKK